jgi:hypothetical protein
MVGLPYGAGQRIDLIESAKGIHEIRYPLSAIRCPEADRGSR